MIKVELLALRLYDRSVDDGLEPQLRQELVGMGAMAHQAEGLEVGRMVTSAALPGQDVVHLGEPGRDTCQWLVAFLAMGPVASQDTLANLLPPKRFQCRGHALMAQMLPTALIAPSPLLHKRIADLMRDQAALEVEEGGVALSTPYASSYMGGPAARNLQTDLVVPCPMLAALLYARVAHP